MTYKRKYKYVMQNGQIPRSSHYKAIKSNKFYKTNFLNRCNKVSSKSIQKSFANITNINSNLNSQLEIQTKNNTSTPEEDLASHGEYIDDDYMCIIEDNNLKKFDDFDEEEPRLFSRNEIRELLEFETNELEISAIMLATFYAANLTQSAFSIVSELINGLCPYEVPSTYDKCAQLVLKKYNQSIDYKKTLFCKQCRKVVAIINLNQQRFCAICNKK